MMDFTYADMKFRSHFNDDEEEEYVSQSFTRFRIKGTSNEYFFWKSNNPNISKIN